MPRRATLLIVEDEALIAMELEDLVTELGYRVGAVAGTVDCALGAIARSGAELDGAVLDANLGRRSALPVAEALHRAGIPYIITTGYDATDLREWGFEAPSIRKPVRKQELHRALAGLDVGGSRNAS